MAETGHDTTHRKHDKSCIKDRFTQLLHIIINLPRS